MDAQPGTFSYVYDWSCRYISCDEMIKNIRCLPVLPFGNSTVSITYVLFNTSIFYKLMVDWWLEM
jgi:hypothetical protein